MALLLNPRVRRLFVRSSMVVWPFSLFSESTTPALALGVPTACSGRVVCRCKCTSFEVRMQFSINNFLFGFCFPILGAAAAAKEQCWNDHHRFLPRCWVRFYYLWAIFMEVLGSSQRMSNERGEG